MMSADVALGLCFALPIIAVALGWLIGHSMDVRQGWGE